MFKILAVLLKRKKYFFVTLLTTLIMFALSYYLTVKTIFQKSIVIYADMNGVFFTIVSLILSLIFAVLFGSYLALLIFKRDIVKARTVNDKTAGLGGIVTSLLASGCPSCGAPLLGLFGLPLGLISLPFKGIEIKLFSIAFLFLATFLITKNIKKNLTCQV